METTLKVYVLQCDDQVEKVFSTRELAEKYCGPEVTGYFIEEVELVEAVDDSILRKVYVAHGNADACKYESEYYTELPSNYSCDTTVYLGNRVLGPFRGESVKSMKDARLIAEEAERRWNIDHTSES